jgi:hypothetical protein
MRPGGALVVAWRTDRAADVDADAPGTARGRGGHAEDAGGVPGDPRRFFARGGCRRRVRRRWWKTAVMVRLLSPHPPAAPGQASHKGGGRKHPHPGPPPPCGGVDGAVGTDGETDRYQKGTVGGVGIYRAYATRWELPAAGDRLRWASMAAAEGLRAATGLGIKDGRIKESKRRGWPDQVRP